MSKSKKAVLRQIVLVLYEQYPFLTEAVIARIARCSKKKVHKILASNIKEGEMDLGEGQFVRIRFNPPLDLNTLSKPHPIITFP